jgi:hypothetical protein
VPIWTASAPSAKAAAIARPSLMPPSRRHDRQAHGVAHLRQQRNQTRLSVDVVGQEHAAMPAGLAALGNDCVGAILFEPARLGDGGGR